MFYFLPLSVIHICIHATVVIMHKYPPEDISSIWYFFDNRDQEPAELIFALGIFVFMLVNSRRVGPLVDRLLEPLLIPGGRLAGNVGLIIGVGPGRGIGLLFIAMGMLKVAVTLASLLNPRVRRIEDELPDAIAQDSEGITTQAAAS